MIIEIFYAFLVRIIKLFHRNFIATIFVSILVVLVRRKYKCKWQIASTLTKF